MRIRSEHDPAPTTQQWRVVHPHTRVGRQFAQEDQALAFAADLAVILAFGRGHEVPVTYPNGSIVCLSARIAKAASTDGF
jgi:hypothetical protein